jgi:hypothetical protein
VLIVVVVAVRAGVSINCQEVVANISGLTTLVNPGEPFDNVSCTVSGLVVPAKRK